MIAHKSLPRNKVAVAKRNNLWYDENKEVIRLENTTLAQSDVYTDLPEVTLDDPEVLENPPKKRSWIPYLILAVLFTVGLAVYLCIPKEAPVLTDPDMPWFSVCDGVLSYDSTLYTGSEKLVVPETIAGQTVTAIGGGCFAGDDYITTVDLPKTVTTIGESAFADCTSLRGVFLPSGVTSIGDKAFRGCAALESVCIPYTVQTVGSEAFADCMKLLHIFFTGTKDEWASLYTERMNPQTKIYATDGVLNHKEIATHGNS